MGLVSTLKIPRVTSSMTSISVGGRRQAPMKWNVQQKAKARLVAGGKHQRTGMFKKNLEYLKFIRVSVGR